MAASREFALCEHSSRGRRIKCTNQSAGAETAAAAVAAARRRLLLVANTKKVINIIFSTRIGRGQPGNRHGAGDATCVRDDKRDDGNDDTSDFFATN